MFKKTFSLGYGVTGEVTYSDTYNTYYRLYSDNDVILSILITAHTTKIAAKKDFSKKEFYLKDFIERFLESIYYDVQQPLMNYEELIQVLKNFNIGDIND